MRKLKLAAFAGILSLMALTVKAQQNHSLYLMHAIPESNLLNPAIPLSCKWYIGLPVLSSVHLNYKNSSFSFNNLFESSGGGAYQPNLDFISNKLHWRNAIGTEIHLQLFALGYKYKGYSFIFSATEKNNLMVTFPKQIVALGFDGNGQFLGKTAGLKGTGIFFNHYREYAIGVSKETGNGTILGARAKLLFGKLNVSTKKANLGLFTDKTTYNLEIDGQILVNSSLPILVDATNNRLNSMAYNDVSPVALALNRKNPGFAIDLGIIYPWTEQITLSASALDLGFIRWRSNLNSFNGSGNYVFTGPLGSSTSSSYWNNLGNSFLDSIHFEVTPKKYFTFLPPRFMAAADYRYNPQLAAGLVGNLLVYKTKAMPSLSLVARYEPFRYLGFMASYTWQNYSFNSVGAGFYIGRKPIQFYLVTDNLMAAFKPFDTRNINLRFGFNIIFGCSKKAEKEAVKKGGNSACFGYKDQHKKSYLKKFKPWKVKKYEGSTY